MRIHRIPNLVLASALVVVGAGLASPAAADPPTDLDLVELATITDPVAIRHAGDGSNRLFVVQQPGVISILDPATGTVAPTPYLDIQAQVASGGEQGLLGLAFHPDYTNNGHFYVDYTYDPGPGADRTRVERYTVSAGDPDVADPMSAQILLEIEQDASNHNGGDIHFGPDGYLYIAMGDGGFQGDTSNRAQSMDQLLGKILRVDVDGTPPGVPNDLCGLVTNYGIPGDNPFAGGSGDCDEIWAVGLRNPWRFSFDRATGDMFIGDVGYGAREEVDFEPAGSGGGRNYAWSCHEGTLVPNYNACTGAAGPLIDPVLEYDHTLGSAITGGFRYRGTIPGFGGTYVYSDPYSGRVWFASPDGMGGWTSTQWQDTALSPATFGEDERGELYVGSLFTNTILRFESPSSIFGDGFEYGTASPWSATQP
jgi:glucose/arabinose dehydrogenase